MFITSKRSGYDRDGGQVASGLFLVLVQPPGIEGTDMQVRAFVRHCALRQLGAWMMGKVRVGKLKLTVSGSYGSDGLTSSIPQSTYDKCFPLPAELYNAWRYGGGWNGAGSEAYLIRNWALTNLEALRDAGK